MAPVNLIIGISHIVTGLLIIALSIPLINGSVKMNYLYGIRFRKSFESEENWYKINLYGAKKLITWSVVLIAIGIAALFMPPLENLILIIVFASAPVLVLIPAVWQSYAFAKQQ